MKNTQRLSILLVACLLMGTVAQVAATAGRARMPVTESRPVVSPGITSNFKGPLHANKPVTNMQDEGRALVVAPANVEARPKASFFKNPVQAIKDAWRYEPQRFEKGSTAPLGTTGFATDAMKEKAQKIRITTASHYETQATGVSQLPKSISRWVQDKGASIQLRQAERQGLIDSQYAAKKQPAAKIEDKVAGGVTKRAIRQQFREGTLVDSTARPSADKSLLERFRTKAENAAISTARFIAPTPPRRAENASADRPAPVRVIPQGDAQAPTPPTKSRGQLPEGVQVYATKEEGQRAAAEQNAAIQARWAKQAPAAPAVGEPVTSRPLATQIPGQPPLPVGPPPQAPLPPVAAPAPALPTSQPPALPKSPAPALPMPRDVDPRLSSSNADIAVRRLAPRPSGLPLPQQDIAAPIAQPAAPVVSGRGPAPALPMSRPPARPAASVVEEPMISQQPPALPTSRPPARPTTPVAEESVASIRRQPVQDVPTPNVTETSRLNISAPLPGAKSTQDRVFDRSNPTTAGDLNVFSGNRTPITSDAKRSHGQAYQDLRSHMDQVQGQLAPGQMSILKKMASDPKATAADLDQLRNQLPPKPTQ